MDRQENGHQSSPKRTMLHRLLQATRLTNFGVEKVGGSIILQSVVAVVVTALFASLVAGCGSSEKKAVAPPEMPSMPVKIEIAQIRAMKVSYTYVGLLVSAKSVNLHSQVEGYVTKIFQRSGQMMAAGEPIISIDPQKQVSTVHGLESAVSSAKAEKENGQHNLQALQFARASQLNSLAFDKEQFQRYQELFQQGVVSEEEQQQHATTLSNTEAGLKKIDAEIKAQQATILRSERNMQQATDNVNAQKIQLGFYTIKAPFAGILGDMKVKLGDYVDTSSPLTSVSVNRPLEVYIQVPADQARDLKLGLEAELLNPDESVLGRAKVFFISPQVVSDTQSVLVKALFSNEKGLLRTGQAVKVNLDLRTDERLAVPVTAVTHIAEQDFVFVAEGSTNLVAKLKPVKLGAIDGEYFEVQSGISPNEKVIVSGIQTLADGVPVHVQSNGSK